MNQPKFKFGDRVAAIAGSTPFAINKIEYLRTGTGLEYVYSGINDHYGNSEFTENTLELFVEKQEPLKKKLYAWSSSDGVIFHVADEKAGREVFHRIGINASNFMRAFDYDIEYPEAK